MLGPPCLALVRASKTPKRVREELRTPKLNPTETAPGGSFADYAPQWPPWFTVGAVAAGGALGALLRYAFVLSFPVDPGRFPVVTFFENLAGSFALAFVLTALLGRWRRFSPWRAPLCTGVLGSFTTFSTFSLELFELSVGGWSLTALLYAASSVGGGLTAALLGLLLARRLLGTEG